MALTPEQIAEECRQVRLTWTDQERRLRDSGYYDPHRKEVVSKSSRRTRIVERTMSTAGILALSSKRQPVDCRLVDAVSTVEGGVV